MAIQNTHTHTQNHKQIHKITKMKGSLGYQCLYVGFHSDLYGKLSVPYLIVVICFIVSITYGISMYAESYLKCQFILGNKDIKKWTTNDILESMKQLNINVCT